MKLCMKEDPVLLDTMIYRNHTLILYGYKNSSLEKKNYLEASFKLKPPRW